MTTPEQLEVFLDEFIQQNGTNNEGHRIIDEGHTWNLANQLQTYLQQETTTSAIGLVNELPYDQLQIRFEDGSMVEIRGEDYFYSYPETEITDPARIQQIQVQLKAYQAGNTP